jgi:hypothetical protein
MKGLWILEWHGPKTKELTSFNDGLAAMSDSGPTPIARATRPSDTTIPPILALGCMGGLH